jgi:TonB family protein
MNSHLWRAVPSALLVVAATAGLGAAAECEAPSVREAVAPLFDDAAAALRIAKLSFGVEVVVDEEGVPRSARVVTGPAFEPLSRAVRDAALAWRFSAAAPGQAPRKATIGFTFLLHERDGGAPPLGTVFRLPCEIIVSRNYNVMPTTEVLPK